MLLIWLCKQFLPCRDQDSFRQCSRRLRSLFAHHNLPRLDLHTVLVETRTFAFDTDVVRFFEIVGVRDTCYILQERKSHIVYHHYAESWEDYEETHLKVASGFQSDKKFKMHRDRMHFRMQGKLTPKFVIDKGNTHQQLVYIGNASVTEDE